MVLGFRFKPQYHFLLGQTIRNMLSESKHQLLLVWKSVTEAIQVVNCTFMCCQHYQWGVALPDPHGAADLLGNYDAAQIVDFSNDACCFHRLSNPFCGFSLEVLDSVDSFENLIPNRQSLPGELLENLASMSTRDGLYTGKFQEIKKDSHRWYTSVGAWNSVLFREIWGLKRHNTYLKVSI